MISRRQFVTRTAAAAALTALPLPAIVGAETPIVPRLDPLDVPEVARTMASSQRVIRRLIETCSVARRVLMTDGYFAHNRDSLLQYKREKTQHVYYYQPKFLPCYKMPDDDGAYEMYIPFLLKPKGTAMAIIEGDYCVLPTFPFSPPSWSIPHKVFDCNTKIYETANYFINYEHNALLTLLQQIDTELPSWVEFDYAIEQAFLQLGRKGQGIATTIVLNQIGLKKLRESKFGPLIIPPSSPETWNEVGCASRYHIACVGGLYTADIYTIDDERLNDTIYFASIPDIFGTIAERDGITLAQPIVNGLATYHYNVNFNIQRPRLGVKLRFVG